MAQRYVIEHKQMREQRVDVLWNATWKYTVLVLYWGCLGLAAGGLVVTFFYSVLR